MLPAQQQEEKVEFQVAPKVFADETGWVSRVLPTKSATPILNNILITATVEDGLRISGTNGEASAEAILPATVLTEGTALAPGRLIADIAKSLPQKDVTISVDGGGSRLLLTCGRSIFKLPIAPMDTYPRLPAQPQPLGTAMGEELTAAVAQVAFACARDELQPVLTAILIEFRDDGSMTLVATDKYRLTRKHVPWTPGERATCNVLLRGKALLDALRPAHPGPVALSLDSTQSMFGITAGWRRSVMPVLDFDFPDYKRLLFASQESSVRFEIAEFTAAVRRIRLVADKPSIPLLASFTDGEVVLSAGGVGSDTTVSEAVPCSVDGDAVDTAFNPEYLLEGLGALMGDEALLRMNGPIKPVEMSAVGDDSYLCLMVPVRS